MDIATGQQPNVRFCLRKVVPVCSRSEAICPNVFHLTKNCPLTIGRTLSKDVQVKLLSKTTPFMISRKHASLHVSNDGKVFVEDHNSLNGVYISNKRILPGTHHELTVGDKIAFGCGIGINVIPEFEYYLEAISATPVLDRRMENSSIDYDVVLTSPSKRKRTSRNVLAVDMPTSRNVLAVDMPSLTIVETGSVQTRNQEEKIRQHSDDLQFKENAIKDELKREESDKCIFDRLVCQRLALENEHTLDENRLQDLLEKQLKEKEEHLKNDFDEQIRILQAEIDAVESNLQRELNCKLNEKDEAHQKALEEQKLTLEKVMREKELEKNTLLSELKAKDGILEKYKSVEENQKQLESYLEELKKEIEDKKIELNKQKEVTKKVETDAKQTVIQTMEDEFTCTICQELFMDATTLPCAHSFCELCLRLWIKTKKSCPVCRRRIKVKAFRSVVLDSAIEKMIEAMDEDTKRRRLELKKEREEQKSREDKADAQCSK